MPNQNGIRIIAAIQVTLIVILFGLSAYSAGVTIYHGLTFNLVGIFVGIFVLILSSVACFYLSRFYADFKVMFM